MSSPLKQPERTPTQRFTRRTTLRANKSLGVVPGESHSSEALAAERERIQLSSQTDPWVPSHGFSSLEYLIGANVTQLEWFPSPPHPNHHKNEASSVAYTFP